MSRMSNHKETTVSITPSDSHHNQCEKVLSLQGLRFVFILLVFFSHIFGSSFDFGGECGVSFFLILSGFVLSYANHDSICDHTFHTQSLYLRQLRKMYPLHILLMTAILVLDARLGTFPSADKIVFSALLLQSWIPFEDYYFVANGPSWFLCDILFCYLVFRTLYSFIMRIKKKTLFCTALAVVILYILFATVIPDRFVNAILYVNPLPRCLDFACGIIIYRLYATNESRSLAMKLAAKDSTFITLLEFITVLLLTATFFIYQQINPRYRCAALFWAILPALIYFYTIIDHHGGLITRLLQTTIMQKLGAITMEFYLIHYLIIRMTNGIWGYFGISIPAMLNLLIMLAATIAVSFLAKAYIVDKLSLSPIKTNEK